MYKVGYNSYGIKILRIHSEFVEFNHITNKWKYHCTQYYTKVDNKLHFLYEYELNTLIGKRKYICKQVKLMLD